MNPIQKVILKTGSLAALFAIACTAIVSFINQQTYDRIQQNERIALLDGLNVLIPSDQYDNDILSDSITLPPIQQLGTTESTLVYRARKEGQPVAAAMTIIAPDGYSGTIKMLIGIRYDGTIAGVRVIFHKETPGLGDKIEAKRGDWILQFAGMSLENPPSAMWKVKKDGGQFDQFSGATITPRVIVKAIKQSLEYFNANRDAFFSDGEE